jgi:chemotaxis protein methyltransferase CheR
VLGLKDFGEYLDVVRSDASGGELTSMLDALCTNLTGFFREPAHFAYLAEHVVPACAKRSTSNRRLRIWSAGCSTGEEPYSIAMAALGAAIDPSGWDIGVLATDLSTKALLTAKKGVYSADRVEAVPAYLRARCFDLVQRRPEKLYRVGQEVRDLIHFARMNLTGPWPMEGPFDVIFCRNVMIYFEPETERQLVERFWQLLAPGGLLMIGHSESLATLRDRFRYVQPTVYRKV